MKVIKIEGLLLYLYNVHPFSFSFFFTINATPANLQIFADISNNNSLLNTQPYLHVFLILRNFHVTFEHLADWILMVVVLMIHRILYQNLLVHHHQVIVVFLTYLLLVESTKICNNLLKIK